MTEDEKDMLIKVAASTQRIERALLGDKDLGIEGLAETIQKNTRHRKRVNRAALIAGGSSVAGGAGYTWWDKILSIFN